MIAASAKPPYTRDIEASRWMCSVAEKASSQMPPTAKSTMYSATSAGDGISRVIPAFTA